SVPAGTVIQVFQAGYELDERILRPAMVVVAKGGAKPVKPVADPGPADAANDTSAAEQSSGETDPPKSDDGAAA
ncbi:MAG: nucleotide exchange factor GrpE, partial [Pseudomonadota bacterium]